MTLEGKAVHKASLHKNHISDTHWKHQLLCDKEIHHFHFIQQKVWWGSIQDPTLQKPHQWHTLKTPAIVWQGDTPLSLHSAEGIVGLHTRPHFTKTASVTHTENTSYSVRRRYTTFTSFSQRQSSTQDLTWQKTHQQHALKTPATVSQRDTPLLLHSAEGPVGLHTRPHFPKTTSATHTAKTSYCVTEIHHFHFIQLKAQQYKRPHFTIVCWLVA